MEQELNAEKLRDAIASMAVEAWRFKGTFSRAMDKLDAGEGQKYMSKFNWFMKKVEQGLEEAHLRTVEFTGQEFNEGMPVNAINLDDFGADEHLYISQTIEPVIMNDDAIFKTGTVVLERYEQ